MKLFVRTYLKSILRQFEQGHCAHDWEPAQLNQQPAIYCAKCELASIVPAEEFYARFGRHPAECFEALKHMKYERN